MYSPIKKPVEKYAASKNVEKRKLTHNDTSEIAGKRAKFHKTTEDSVVSGKVDAQCQFSNPGTRSLKMVIRVPKEFQINPNVQCQYSNPGTKSLKMIIRVPKNCERELSSATTEAKSKQQNIMEKWETPINSNTDSLQCSDSDSESYKTVIRAPKKCPRKSTSAITKKKAPLMKKALKYVKFIKTVRGY